MPGIENKTPLRISLARIKETGFSIRPDLKESDFDKIDWMIGFRPIMPTDDKEISIEVRSVAVLTDNDIEVASCSITLTYNVEDLYSFVSKESDNVININDRLMLNMLNPAYGTLRGVIFARFSGTILENKPLPLINVADLIRSAKKNEASK